MPLVTGLRPFDSRPAVHCPKCDEYDVQGRRVIGTEYHAAGVDGRGCGTGGEHLHRTCSPDGGGCGYHWAEQCADAGKTPPGVGGLRPFRGRRSCPKCRSLNVTKKYMPAGLSMPEEHLSRRCGRCGYRWAEACADTAANGEDPGTPSPPGRPGSGPETETEPGRTE